MFRRFAVIALASATALTAFGSVDAAKGGKGNSNKGGGDSTASIQLDHAAPAFGQTITFTVQSSVDRPFSKVDCRQNGVLVYSSSAGHFEDFVTYFGEPQHTLSSMSWTSGAADCTASLVHQSRNGRWKTEASTSFHVTG